MSVCRDERDCVLRFAFPLALSMVSMLTRIVTRPAATLRRGSQLQRRFIHPLRPQLEAPPRPNTWLAKIRFRADGKPRSKLIALGFGEYSY